MTQKKIGSLLLELADYNGTATLWGKDPERDEDGRATATKGDPGPGYIDRVGLYPEEALVLLAVLEENRRVFETAILKRAVDRVGGGQ